MLSLNLTFVEVEAPETRSLLELARAGDTAAFGEICRTCETRLLRQAMGLCGNASLAEELAQDTLVEAWKSLPRYNGACQFFTWLCAILLNRYRNSRRQKRLVPLSSLARADEEHYQDHLAGVVDQGAQPDQTAQARDQAIVMRNSLATLPEKYQQVIYLRFYVDDSLQEIAGALGCSVGTVKSRLFNGLEKLRRMEASKTHAANPLEKGGRL